MAHGARSVRNEDGFWVPAGLDGNAFMLDAVLPSQFQSSRTWSPEMRLMLAVLEDAIGTLNRLGRSVAQPIRIRGAGVQDMGRRSVDQELDWIASDDLSYPFSFLNICDVLGFDAGAFRRALAHMGFHVEGHKRHLGTGKRGPGPKLHLAYQYRSRA
jgi:hypothetical protein